MSKPFLPTNRKPDEKAEKFCSKGVDAITAAGGRRKARKGLWLLQNVS